MNRALFLSRGLAAALWRSLCFFAMEVHGEERR
jgi:hypothetical protein